MVSARRCSICAFIVLVMWQLFGTYFNSKRLEWNNSAPFTLGGYTSCNSSMVGSSGSHARNKLDCSNINEIQILRTLGIGGCRTAFLGEFHSRKVVVKLINGTSTIFTRCLQTFNSKPLCSAAAMIRAMKEILFLQQLKHPNLPAILGFCFQGRNVDSLSLRKHGIIAVYEYGEQIRSLDMARWSFPLRLDIAIQLMDLCVYAEHSPLGSLRLVDVNDKHFVMVGNYIKFIDIERFATSEPHCSAVANGTGCKFNLSCVNNHCAGFNAKFNMHNMERLFLRRLLRFTRLEDDAGLSNQEESHNIVEGRKVLDSVRSGLQNIATANNTDIYRKLITIRNLIKN